MARLDRRGHWIHIDWDSPTTNCIECSECHYRYKYLIDSSYVASNYCPSCGANMLDKAEDVHSDFLDFYRYVKMGAEHLVKENPEIIKEIADIIADERRQISDDQRSN